MPPVDPSAGLSVRAVRSAELSERAVRWRRPEPALSFLLAALFLALAAAVWLGALSGLDQYAVDHWMPGLRPPSSQHTSLLDSLTLPFGPGTSWSARALDLWTYPCSVLVSGLGVGACVRAGIRRGRGQAALAPAAAWVLGNALELAGKHLVRRPALFGHAHKLSFHVAAFDTSFPSGHMLRGAILFATVAAVWPAARRALAGWYLLVGPFLVLSAAHTVSDVVGGLLLGWLLVRLAALPPPWSRRPA